MSNAGKIKAGMAYIEITTENSKLMRGLAAAQKALKNFGISVQTVGGDLLRLAGTMSIPLAMSVKAFADFDDQMRTVQAVGQTTNAELEHLTDTAEELGATTAFSSKQVAEGMVSLARMGFTAREVSQSIKPVLNLVRATGTEMFRLGDVSELAAAAMRNFKIPASEMTDVCDVLTYAANASAMDIFDLGEAMKIIGPTAYPVGDSLRDVAANMMTLANAGIKGSLAGTALRKVYQSLAQQTGEEATQLKELGIALKDVNGNLRRPMDIMRDLSVVVAKMKSGEKINFSVDVFDLRGSLGALPMLSATKETKGFRNALDDVNGIADVTAAKMENGLGGALRMLYSRFQALQIIVGRAIDESFRGAIVSFTEMLDSVRKWVRSNKQLVAQLALVVASAAAAGIALIAFGLSIKIVAHALAGVIIIFKVLMAAVLLPVNALIMLTNVITYLGSAAKIISFSIGAVGTAFRILYVSCYAATFIVAGFTGIMSAATAVFLIHKKSLLAAKAALTIFRIQQALTVVGTVAMKVVFFALQGVIYTLIGACYAIIGAMKALGAICGIAAAAGKMLAGVMLTAGMIFQGLKIAALAVSSAYLSLAFAVGTAMMAFHTFCMSGKAALVVTKILSAGIAVLQGVAIGIVGAFQLVRVAFTTFSVSALASKVAAIALGAAVRLAGTAAIATNVAIKIITGTLVGLTAIMRAGGIAAVACMTAFTAVKTALISAGLAIKGAAAAVNTFIISGKAAQMVAAGISISISVIKGICIGVCAAFQLLAVAIKTFSLSAVASQVAAIAASAAIRGVAVSALAANIAVKVVCMTFKAMTAISVAWAAVMRGLSMAVAAVCSVFKTVKAAIMAFNITSAAGNAMVMASSIAMKVWTAVVNGVTAAIALLKSALISLKTVILGLKMATIAGSLIGIAAAIGVGIVAWKLLCAVCKQVKVGFDIIWGSMKDLGSGFIAAFGNIKIVAGEAYGIVKDALLAGDTAGAAKVAMSALYIIWLEGIAPLKKAWAGLKSFLCDSWTIIKSVVLKAANNLWYGLLMGLKTIGYSIADTWNKVWDGIISAFESTIGWLKKKWIQFKGFFDSKINVDAEIAKVDQEIADNKAERAKRTNTKIGERDADLADTNKNWDESNKKIDDRMAADIAASSADYNAALQKASGDLEAARQGYEDSKKFAAQWKTMQSAAKALQQVFDESGEDYRINRAHKDTEAQDEKKKVEETAKTDKPAAQQMMRDIISREKQKAQVAKEEFEKALKEAQADRVIDPKEKANLERYAAEYGRASELKTQYEGMLQSSADGTTNAASLVSPQSFGSFSSEVLDAMIGGTGSAAERTAKATEEALKEQKETNKIFKHLKSGSGTLAFS